MASKNTPKHEPDNTISDTATLPSGVSIESGQEVRIEGLKGTFRFRYVWIADGSLTCHGPIDSQHAQTRSFKPERVKKINHKPVSRRTRIEMENQ